MISEQQKLKEYGAINMRRAANGKQPIMENGGGANGQPGLKNDTTGLALSGGGIRSAATCLGVLQALQVSNRLRDFDYLSTVSGGGYTGCCLTVNASERGFPFLNEQTDLNDLQDSPAVRYIRDHTNYLMPAGFSDFLATMGVILRGLTASTILFMSPILLLAGLTCLLWKSGGPVALLTGSDMDFGLTILAVVLLVVYLAVLAVHYSRLEFLRQVTYEFRGNLSKWAVFGICCVVILFVLELQPVAIKALIAPKDDDGFFWRFIVASISASKFLAPFAGVVAAFAGWFADVAKTSDQSRSKLAMLRSLTSRAVVWIAALVLPLLLWQLYLALVCVAIPVNEGYPFAIDRLAPYGGFFFVGYLLVGTMLACIGWRLEPNANSLHRLYRDRLGDAFLFLAPTGTGRDVNSVDRMKLSAIDTSRALYPLINTALNIQRSEYANKRGRDADFFLFSPDYIGSRATGYVPTKIMEEAVPTLDVATIMAVSGAAASSNMGGSALKPLAFTLALLNVRLGYWMTNPSRFVKDRIDFAGKEIDSRKLRQYLRSVFYLWSEMLSTLDETNDAVYLTDGGHVENLGLYELLKRRCRLILVVDAEADPELRFSSFMALQRYARLDLGVRIELPWQKIRSRYVSCNNEILECDRSGTVLAGAHGCHVAVGQINYPDSGAGMLIYLKSTITGDENDIVLNYKRKYPSFPHETTIDQFFGEEQFEAYRALGFHAMQQFLAGEDEVAGLSVAANATKQTRVAEIGKLF